MYQPPALDQPKATSTLVQIAQEFSPRYERHHDHLVSIDVGGLDRLLGPPRVVAHELRREAADRGVRVHVAIAGTRMAALVLALARPGITVVRPGEEAAALAPIVIGMLDTINDACPTVVGADPAVRPRSSAVSAPSASSASSAFTRWGLKTLGELAALPSADLAARLGRQGLAWQAIARGEDVHPLVPTLAEERFESSIELEWPIEGLEPLSFVLTRLLEPLSTRLERRDRGATAVHVSLRLVTKAVHARRLQLPAPLREVRTLRTLLLVDLESHPPPAAVEVVSVAIDPTPGWVLQHKLFTRAHPTPDEISTLLARLGALMGQDRIGRPSIVDSYYPGAFEMKPFVIAGEPAGRSGRSGRSGGSDIETNDLFSGLRRFRRPVAARVTVEEERPVRVMTDRPGFTGGSVIATVGPWRTSGNWWGSRGSRGSLPEPLAPLEPLKPWDRDEWDVALSDGAVYRMFQNRETGGWFIDGILD